MQDTQTPILDPSVTNKLACFEYMLDKFIDWLNKVNPDKKEPIGSFSKLSLIKLNFFTSAIGADSSNPGLLDIFDRFHAMPYGHVEMDIYENTTHLKKYKFEGNILALKDNNHKILIDNSAKDKIDKSIDQLKSENINIIEYSPFELVELSHRWNSWSILYNIAQMKNTKSIQIPIDIIKEEVKIFKL